MTAQIFDEGDLVRLYASFTKGRNPAVPTNPTDITVTVKAPDGSVKNFVTGDLTNDSTGNYHVDFDVDQTGHFYFRYAGTGAVKAAGEGEFYVRAREVTGTVTVFAQTIGSGVGL